MLDSLNRGGAEMLALDVCRNARANDLELIFVALGGGDLEPDFRDAGVEFIRLQRKFPVDLGLVVQLRRVIKEHGVQVVHSHQAVEALHSYLATLGTNVKRVLSFHLCAADAKNRLTLKPLVPRMDVNVAVSHSLLNCLGMEGGFDTSRNFHVIYNGVDAKRLQPTNRRLRAELGLSADHILIGMIGNFYPGARKDQLTVCQALPQLFGRAANVHFAFVGGRTTAHSQVYDECVSYCHGQNIADRVHFLGKRSDIPDVLSALDIFVLSSLHEGLPVAVIEAMMMGLPSVVSDIEPLVEVSGEGRYAKVFRRKDAEDLAEKLISLVEDSARRTQLGAAAKEWAQTQFSIETHLANLSSLYISLVRTA